MPVFFAALGVEPLGTWVLALAVVLNVAATLKQLFWPSRPGREQPVTRQDLHGTRQELIEKVREAEMRQERSLALLASREELAGVRLSLAEMEKQHAKTETYAHERFHELAGRVHDFGIKLDQRMNLMDERFSQLCRQVERMSGLVEHLAGQPPQPS